MEEIGHNGNDIKMLYEMNRKAEIIVDRTVGQTENINIKKLFNKVFFGPIICCITTSKVNSIGGLYSIVMEKLILECQFT